MPLLLLATNNVYICQSFYSLRSSIGWAEACAGSLEEGVGEELHLALYVCAFVYDGNKHGYKVTNAVRESF